MNILVTGGSGLFGRKTVLYLLNDPDVKTVVSMDITPPKEWFMESIGKNVKKFHFVQGNVTEIEDLLNAMRQYKIDRLINWAFIMVAEDAPVDPRLVTKVNVMGMSNAFEAAKIMGAKRVVYASSETVYGPQAMHGMREVTEDDQTNPTHSYAVCKKYAEILAAAYTQQYGMSITGVRPTIGYGHGGRSPAQYWSDMPSNCAIGKPFSMEGDGRGLASLVAADDLAEFTKRLIKAPTSPHPVYNVGGPPQSPRDLAAAVKKYLPDARITFGKKSMMDKEGKTELPWLVSGKRAKRDFKFSCMTIERAVLIHINDARLEAGMKPLRGKRRQKDDETIISARGGK
ncbi:MAG: NAD-dependent epimerase/dehydratase family protein [Dehalococcoidales bacterium]|nr:NAD-dependent epimerase/dehydratase family protein [Dehalococcoidales bacterium]